MSLLTGSSFGSFRSHKLLDGDDDGGRWGDNADLGGDLDDLEVGSRGGGGCCEAEAANMALLASRAWRLAAAAAEAEAAGWPSEMVGAGDGGIMVPGGGMLYGNIDMAAAAAAPGGGNIGRCDILIFSISASCNLLDFALRFWNQIFTCVSVRLSLLENSARSAMLRYCFSRNFFSSAMSCCVVNGVLGFLLGLCFLRLHLRGPRFGRGMSGPEIEKGEHLRQSQESPLAVFPICSTF